MPESCKTCINAVCEYVIYDKVYDVVRCNKGHTEPVFADEGDSCCDDWEERPPSYYDPSEDEEGWTYKKGGTL